LDDVDAWDSTQQQAAFAVMASAPSQRAVWVSSSRLPPIDLPIREDLRTRLGWGLVFALDVLDEHHTRLVLRQEALRRGWVLRDDVLEHLMLHVERDLVHLMRVLDHLDAGALAEGRAVNLTLVRRLLRSLPRTLPGDGHEQENLWSHVDELGLV
jgi:DnaA family protein